MYVKVFPQILDSSIAVDYEQRHVFEDLLKLADREGVVDMTHEAIARRVNVPEAIIRQGIAKLEEPDPLSRSEEYEGRRIIRLAEHRDWGWQIVNYVFYRDLIDAESLRRANRERKREQRARDRARHEMSHGVRDVSQRSQKVTLSESELEANEEKSSSNGSSEPLQAALSLGSDVMQSKTTKPKKSPLMSRQAIEELQQIPIYQGIDIAKEAWKFRTWCETNNKTQSKRRFVNWLNRIT